MQFYNLALIALIIFYFASWFFFFYTLQKNRIFALELSYAAFFITFLLSPDTAELFYWLSGNVTYLLSASMLLIFAAFLFADHLSMRQKFIALFLLTPILAGTHELALLSALAIILFYICFFKKTHEGIWPYISLATLILLTLVFLVYGVGGTQKRFMMLQEFPDFKSISLTIIGSFARFLFQLLKSVPLWMFIFIIVLLSNSEAYLFDTKTFLYVLAIFAFCFILIAIHPIAMGIAPPRRIYSYTFIILLMLLSTGFFHQKTVLRVSFSDPQKRHRNFASLIFLLSLLTGVEKNKHSDIVITSNLTQLMYDVFVCGNTHRMHQKEIITKLQAASTQNSEVVLIQSPTCIPWSIVFIDLCSTPHQWIVDCQCKYYHYNGSIVCK